MEMGRGLVIIVEAILMKVMDAARLI